MSPQTAASGCGESVTNQPAGSLDGTVGVGEQQIDRVLVGGLLTLGRLAAAHVLLPPPATTQRGDQRKQRPPGRDQREVNEALRSERGLAS